MNCAHCNGLIKLTFDEKTNAKLTANKTCFACDYWLLRVSRIGHPDQIVIDGHCYQNSGDKSGQHEHCGKTGFMGFGGHRFTWKMLETGEVQTSNDMWSNGTIPQHFRDQVPDNAEWVKTEDFRHSLSFGL